MIFSKETLYNLKGKPTNPGERRNFDFQCYDIVRPKNLVSNNNKNNNKNNHKAHKEIGKYCPFKEQNKSTETIPEEAQILDNGFKTTVSKMLKEQKKSINKDRKSMYEQNETICKKIKHIKRN